VTEPTIAAVTAALNECDLVRFSPATVTAQMKQEIFNQAAELISALEKELR
jgi:hypothetical protein